MAILATITCAKCHYQSVVTLSLGSPQSSTNLASDLKPAEVGRFLDLEPISSDDLLDVHQYLKKAKGNFHDDFKVLTAKTKTKKSNQ